MKLIKVELDLGEKEQAKLHYKELMELDCDDPNLIHQRIELKDIF
jgi:hypothetical protein